MKLHLAPLWLFVLAGLALAADPPKQGPSLDDRAFFAALDLSRTDLARVKAAVDADDMAEARQQLVRHLKERRAPKWYFDWRDRPAPEARPRTYDRKLADRFAANELLSCGVWHAFKDRIDWNSNPMPSQYREWTWQLSRHPFWETLGAAYWATGDEKYAKAFVFQMTDWVRNQPMPADSGNKASSTWRTIETGIRTFGSWPNSFMYFLSSPSFDDESVVLMLKSFHDHATHLMKHPTTGNWLAMEANGLFHIGALFPEFKDAAAWRKTAIDRLYVELDKQVYPDGAQIELAAGYHNVSLNSFEMPVRIARMNELALPADYVSKLERMFHYDLYVSMPNGRMPGLNDSGDTAIGSWMTKATKYYPQRQDFRWAATGGKEGAAPKTLSCAFPFAGHLVMRSGWDADARYLLLDAGPFGYGHQHEDKLTIVLAAYGRVHVIDPGNYAYDNSQWRKYHIDTFAHNTVLVDSLPQRRAGARDRWEYVVKQPLPHTFVTRETFDYAAAAYDEGYGKRDNRIATHQREVVFIKGGAAGDFWVIFDSFAPRDDKPHTYDAMYHLNAEAIDIEAADLRVTTRNARGSNLAMIPLKQAGLSVSNQAGQEKPYVQGWVRQGDYGVRPIPTPVYRLEATGAASTALVLFPLKEGQVNPVAAVKAIAQEKERGVEIEFTGGKTQRVLLTGQAAAPVVVGR